MLIPLRGKYRDSGFRYPNQRPSSDNKGNAKRKKLSEAQKRGLPLQEKKILYIKPLGGPRLFCTAAELEIIQAKQ